MILSKSNSSKNVKLPFSTNESVQKNSQSKYGIVPEKRIYLQQTQKKNESSLRGTKNNDENVPNTETF